MPVRTRRPDRADEQEGDAPQTHWHYVADGPHGRKKIEFEEFAEKIANNPQQVYRDLELIFANVHEEVNSLRAYENKYRASKEKISALEREVAELRNRVEALEEEKSQLEEERDDYKAEWRVLGRRIQEMQSGREAGVTPSVIASSTGDFPTKLQKSEKVADPPIFRGKENGKEVEPKFEDWILAMKRKLRANADRYNTEEIRIAYVAGRVGGEAADHLRPYLDEENPAYAETADQLFARLQEVYRDPNRLDKARASFYQLSMGPKDDFHSFHTKFIQLAYEARIRDEEYKYHLNEKLYPRLRELVIQEYAKKGTFAEFVGACATTAHQLRSISESEARRRPGGGLRNRSQTPDAASGMKPTDAPPTKGPDARACYKCGKIGHIAKWCKNNARGKGTAVGELEADSAEAGKELA